MLGIQERIPPIPSPTVVFNRPQISTVGNFDAIEFEFVFGMDVETTIAIFCPTLYIVSSTVFVLSVPSNAKVSPILNLGVVKGIGEPKQDSLYIGVTHIPRSNANAHRRSSSRSSALMFRSSGVRIHPFDKSNLR